MERKLLTAEERQKRVSEGLKLYWRNKKAPPPVRVGMIVIHGDGEGSGCFGVVTEIFPYGREDLYHVHKIDHSTGQLFECPDKARCRHRHTCPIHGWNPRREQLAVPPQRDLVFYRDEGLLAQDLIDRHHIACHS